MPTLPWKNRNPRGGDGRSRNLSLQGTRFNDPTLQLITKRIMIGKNAFIGVGQWSSWSHHWGSGNRWGNTGLQDVPDHQISKSNPPKGGERHKT